MRSWPESRARSRKREFCEAILTRQRGLLRFSASGFRGKFDPAVGFSLDDEKK